MTGRAIEERRREENRMMMGMDMRREVKEHEREGQGEERREHKRGGENRKVG